MNYIDKICAVLIIINGIGHLLVVVYYEKQPSFWLIILFGVLYTVLGIGVWIKGRRPLVITAGIMLLAMPVAIMLINRLGYPVILLALFIAIDFVVVILTGLMMKRSKREL